MHGQTKLTAYNAFNKQQQIQKKERKKKKAFVLLLCMIVWHAINNITMCVVTFALLGILDPGKWNICSGALLPAELCLNTKAAQSLKVYDINAGGKTIQEFWLLSKNGFQFQIPKIYLHLNYKSSHKEQTDGPKCAHTHTGSVEIMWLLINRHSWWQGIRVALSSMCEVQHQALFLLQKAKFVFLS